MAFEDVPDGNGQFTGDRDGRFVGAAPQGDRDAPLLQRVTGGQQSFAGLDEERPQAAAPVLTQGAAAFKLAAFDDAGIETQIADEFLAGGKALDVADVGDQRMVVIRLRTASL